MWDSEMRSRLMIPWDMAWPSIHIVSYNIYYSLWNRVDDNETICRFTAHCIQLTTVSCIFNATFKTQFAEILLSPYLTYLFISARVTLFWWWGYWGRAVDIATSFTLDDSGFEPRWRQDIFSSPHLYIPALGPNRSPHCFAGVKQSGRGAGCPPLPSAEVNNEYWYICRKTFTLYCVDLFSGRWCKRVLGRYED